MTDPKGDSGKPKDTNPSEAEKATEASRTAKRSEATKEEELDEGLEESFPGSDAPASTRRSGKD